jgi:hypothetical protein
MIEPTIFNVIGLSVIGVMIAFWYEPIQKPKNYLIKLLPCRVSVIVNKVLSCSKCSSFTLGLLLTLDIPAAALCALSGFIIGFIIDYINVWYEG